jgi:GT2 family glycosyltransferase
MKLSIIIVNYNTRDLLAQTIQSVQQHVTTDYEIIVVDNDSQDGSVEYIKKCYPSVKLIASNKNLGFAAGNNLGFASALGEFVFFLNPDTIVKDSSVDELVHELELHPEYGIVAPKLVYGDGSLQRSIRPFYSFWSSLFDNRFLNPVLSQFPNASIVFPFVMNHHENAYVDWVKGAAFMMRSELYRQLNGFDQQFWIYGEEMDLCKRVHKAGYQIYYKADTQITHLEGQSTRQSSEKMFIQNYRAFYQFLAKHYPVTSLIWYHRRVQLFARIHHFKAVLVQNQSLTQLYSALLIWINSEGKERVLSAKMSTLSANASYSSSN